MRIYNSKGFHDLKSRQTIGKVRNEHHMYVAHVTDRFNFAICFSLHNDVHLEPCRIPYTHDTGVS